MQSLMCYGKEGTFLLMKMEKLLKGGEKYNQISTSEHAFMLL